MSPAVPRMQCGYVKPTAKDPAAIAVAPGLDTQSPAKDIDMKTDTTAPAEKKASDADVANAMRDLENAIRELMHMSDIAAETYDTVFGPSSRVDGYSSGLCFRITNHENDQLTFLVNNVASRCAELHKSFEAAWDGESRA